jgi:hypothetical protein
MMDLISLAQTHNSNPKSTHLPSIKGKRHHISFSPILLLLPPFFFLFFFPRLFSHFLVSISYLFRYFLLHNLVFLSFYFLVFYIFNRFTNSRLVCKFVNDSFYDSICIFKSQPKFKFNGLICFTIDLTMYDVNTFLLAFSI